MSRDERRSQLLASALEIVRAEGTNSLTLVRLAERAGVSRPIAYDHFKTRDGLLVAIYREYDEQIGRTMRHALRDRSTSLGEVVSVLSTAYVDGVLAAGPECEEVYAALAGSQETRGVLQQSRDFYIEEFRAALGPFVPLSRDTDLAMLTGILSVIEGLARAAGGRRISRDEAISGAVTIVVGALGQYTARGSSAGQRSG